MHGKEKVQLGEKAKEALLAYKWPGNVRELENVLRRAVVNGQGETIEMAEFPVRYRTQENGERNATAAGGSGA